jgi:hypothetical protein
VTGGSATIPAGTWYATIIAPGYREANEQIQLGPGEVRTWSPRLEAVPAPAPAPPETTTVTRAVDRTADQAAVGRAIRDFVSALGARDANRVLPLFPPDERDGWRTTLTSRDVTDFTATLRSVGETSFDDDSATTDMVIAVSFRNRNRALTPTLRFTGLLERTDGSWHLVSLRVTGG